MQIVQKNKFNKNLQNTSNHYLLFVDDNIFKWFHYKKLHRFG